MVCGVTDMNCSINGTNNPDTVVCGFSIINQIYSLNRTIICVVIETILDVRVLIPSKTKTDLIFKILW
jgi:hypothetical protein